MLGPLSVSLRRTSTPQTTRLGKGGARSLRGPSGLVEGLLLGNFEPADARLARCGMHLEQLAELPPAEELLPDAPLPDVRRRVQGGSLDNRPAERHAVRAAKAPKVCRADLVKLLRLLPTQKAPRGKAGVGTKCFQSGLFVHGGVLGFLAGTMEWPRATRLMCRFVRGTAPGLRLLERGPFSQHEGRRACRLQQLSYGA